MSGNKEKNGLSIIRLYLPIALFFITTSLLLNSCSLNEKGYVINGIITGAEDLSGMMYLRQQEFGGVPIDSALLVNGKFTFKGRLEDPDQYIIYNPNLPNRIAIFIENARYKITAPSYNLNDAVIDGGESQKLISLTEKKSKEVIEKLNLNSIMADFSNPQTPKSVKDSILAIFNHANATMKGYYDSIIRENPNTWFYLHFTKLSAQGENLDTLQKRYDHLNSNKKFTNSKHLKEIEEVLNKRKALQPGNIANNFNLKDMSGTHVSFYDVTSASDFTILIFWTEWSVESINFAKEIKEIADLAKSKQIKITGVILSGAEQNESMKRKREETIRNEGLTFLNLNDVRESSVASLYNVTLIPRAFLIDRQNVIILDNLTTDDLKLFVKDK
ncbi:MAG: hypothetical protein A2X19_08345 [Bacteroidetes bacterium GWE2_39_28]|nr:MAG: hypothetical protein A2X19_08345 [Bacteroidetes bacterium GWE2_39_28]OFY13280.1 MAG: hypothetical protein A2X16_05180 [Bacteroidetes bacterium GWF2_39_10]OFZ08033.1 MAG: hypothetical protein A2322_02565 [Bacteroidetes bacterium RIFOXYB2_FULL_39_7]OFZ11433.1 MAG: hypothetical protein A2465_04105 [Bacteroidetes bacterium RIFOXYC2_FULL_39_11]HCT93194.1 hypothetical protein [Rikenellaceae bacterium]